MLRSQVARYGFLLRWVFRDALWPRRSRVLLVLGGMALGLSAQGAVIGGVIGYARLIEDGGAVQILGRTWEARESVVLLAGVVVVAACMLWASAGLLLFGRRGAIQLDSDYEQHCSQRALTLLSSSIVTSAALDPPTMRSAQAVIQRIPREFGRFLRIVLFGMQPILTSLAAGVALLWVDAGLTLIVLFIVGFGAIWLYRINLRAVAYTKAQTKYTPQSAQARKQLLQRHIQTPQEDPAGVVSEVSALFSSVESRRTADAYVGRIAVLEHATYSSRVVSAVVLGAVVVVQGVEILGSQAGFSTLVLYVVALRFFLNGTVQAGRTLTSINRFFPPASTYATFVDEATRLQGPVLHVPRSTMTLPIPCLSDADSGALELSLPTSVSLLSSAPLSGFTIGRLARAGMTDQMRANGVWFHTKPSFRDGASLAQLYGLDSAYGVRAFADDLDESSARHLVAEGTLGADPWNPIAPETYARLPSQLHRRLAARAADRRGAGVIVAPSETLSFLAPETLSGARVSVRHCRELSGAAELDDVVLVDDGEAVVGWLPRADMDELDNELRTLFDSPQDERQDDTDLELDDDDF